MGWFAETEERYSRCIERLQANLPRHRSLTSKERACETAQWLLFESSAFDSLPSAGWKVHLSFHPSEFDSVFEWLGSAILPSRFVFKVPKDFKSYLAINEPTTSVTQLGKFVTLYSPSQFDCEETLSLLTATCPPMTGPKVASDLYREANDSFSLRYGQCGAGKSVYDACGREKILIPMPDGTWKADKRSEFGELPWGGRSATFAGTTYTPLPLQQGEGISLGARSFKITRRMGPWFKQAYLAVDESGEKFALQRAHRGACMFFNGLTGDDLLEHSFKNYASLWSRGKVSGPRPEFYELPHFVWLVRGWEEGEDLATVDRPIDSWPFSMIFDAVEELHRNRIIHRDIKPTNILWDTESNSVSLIDLELSGAAGEASAPCGGTVGYRPPEYRSENIACDPSYDVYSLGMLVVQSKTGLNPCYHVTTPETVACALSANGYPELIVPLSKAASPNPESRPSLAELRAAVETTSSVSSVPEPWTTTEQEDGARALIESQLAMRSFREERGGGFRWTYNHPSVSSRDLSINTGSAGTVLGLLELKRLTKRDCFDEEIIGGLRFLESASVDTSIPGLFTGVAGIALTLGRGGAIFSRESSITRAAELYASLANSYIDPDLFFGAAGVVAAGTLLSALTEDSSVAEVARSFAVRLVAEAREHSNIVCWVPSGILDGSTHPKTSISHGTMGIAYALGVWGASQPNERIARQLAGQAYESLFRYGRTKSGTSFVHEVTSSESETPTTIWCRGLSGYLWGLLRVQSAIPDASWVKEALSWGEALLLQEKVNGNPTLCHGLAGQLDLLLDLMADGSGVHSDAILHRANYVARLLLASRVLQRDHLMWPAEMVAWRSPGFWVGNAGSAYALARWLAYCRGDDGWKQKAFSS